jgi:hypothetical protein
MRKNLISSFLIICFCGSCRPPSTWVTFVSPDGDFEIAAPGQLARVKPAPDVVPSAVFQLTASSNGYSTYFHVKRLDFPAGTLAGLSSKILDSALDGVRDQNVAATHGQLVSESPITLGSNRGREIRYSADAGNTVATERLYIVADRVYSVLAVRKPSLEADAAAARFLDSFHLRSQ